MRVASDGTDYLVLWENRVLWEDREFRTQRVLRDGTPAGEPVVSGKSSSTGACVAWTGSEYVVGWTEMTLVVRGIVYSNLHVLSVASDGQHGADVQIAGGVVVQSLDCAAGETSTLFMWSRLSGLYEWSLTGALRTHAGAISPVSLTSRGRHAVVASNGRSFAAAWQMDPQWRAVERAVVSEHGTVSPVNELPLFGLAPEYTPTPVSLGRFGSGYLLAWGTRELRALAMTSDGRSAGETAIARDTHESAIAGGDVPVVLYTRGDRVFTRTIHSAPLPPRRRTARH